MMKRQMLIFSSLLLILAFGFTGVVTAQNYDYTSEMSMEEYNAELQKWQQKEQTAKTRITELNQDIADLKDQIAQVKDQIAQVRQNTMNLLSQQATEEEETVATSSDGYMNQLDMLIEDLKGLLALSPEELYQRQDEFEALKKKLDDLKNSNYALLNDAMKKLEEAEQLVNRLDAKMPEPVNDVYTVMRGDYLWRISGNQDIYDDPYQWVKIWSANRDQINNPNLIYPEQKFDIPRQLRNNEHLVSRGESLSKIAAYGEVYGNPFEWQKLYNANKKVISDPSIIYPHQILTVPQN